MTKPKPSTKLKPCPWCGEIPTMMWFSATEIYIECFHFPCPLHVKTMVLPTEQDAIKIWNTRKGEK